MIDRYCRPEMEAVWSEDSRYKRWLQIEVLVCTVRAEMGLIPVDAAERIARKARFDISRIKHIEEQTRHDVIAFVTNVGESLGDDASYFHEGLTSSDILDTSLAMQMVDASKIIRDDLVGIRAILADLAKSHRRTVMIGRTHGIHAEPMSFAHKTAVFHSDITRSIAYLDHAVEQIRTGKISGAVGNFAHLPPSVEERVCERLGLKPEPAATQVVQRDRHAMWLCTLAVIAGCAEKIAVEIRHLQRTEVAEVEEPFGKGQRGSSAMPHKRNPILCENICGLARLVRGYVVPGLENMSLWHERDISHSSVERIMLPDASLAVDFLLNRLAGVLKGLVVHESTMQSNLNKSHGLIYSQKILLALTGAGVTRDEAYQWVQRNAMVCWKEGLPFEELLKRDRDICKYLSPEQITAAFDPAPYLQYTDYLMQRSGIDPQNPDRVEEQPE